MSEVRIRGFRPEDRDGVLELRARVFEGLDPAREEQRWTWQFDRNPFSREETPPTLVAELDGQMIGNYGMLPLHLSVDGESAFGLCGMDFCVDPAHRNLGLGMRLTRAFIDTAADVHLVTSPTPDAAKLMAYYRSQILSGDAEPCLWVYAGAPAPDRPAQEPVELELSDGFDERVDRLFERAVSGYRLLVTRDRRYLDWRYVQYPFAGARIAYARGVEGDVSGLSVIQREPDSPRAHLCELFAPRGDEASFETLVRDAAAHCLSEGIAELYTFQRDPHVQEILRRNGFLLVQGHGMSAVLRPPAGMSVEDWYLSAGDGDILFGALLGSVS